MATVTVGNRAIVSPAQFYTDGAIELEWLGGIFFGELGCTPVDIDELEIILTPAEQAESAQLALTDGLDNPYRPRQCRQTAH